MDFNQNKNKFLESCVILIALSILITIVYIIIIISFSVISFYLLL